MWKRLKFSPRINLWRRRLSRVEKELRLLHPSAKAVLVVLGIILVVSLWSLWWGSKPEEAELELHVETLLVQPNCKILKEVNQISVSSPTLVCPFQACQAYTKIIVVYNATKKILVQLTESAQTCRDALTQCCAIAYSMPVKSNEAYRYPEKSCYQIQPSQEIQPTVYTEVLEIACHDLCDNRRVANFHPLLPITPRVRNKIRAWTRLNEFRTALTRVIWVSVDSVSRFEAQRSLPLTWQELVDHQNFHDMRGFSMVDNTTSDNFLATLTGFNRSQLVTKCSLKSIGVYDGCPFIWKEFRNFDYITSYLDQVGLKKTLDSVTPKFPVTSGDFIAQPTDFFIPFAFMHERMRLKQLDDLYNSFASTAAEDFILDFTQVFLRKFSHFPLFSVSRLHQESKSLAFIDRKLASFFQAINKLNPNALVVFSSNLDPSSDGVLERPFLLLSIPQSSPLEDHENLRENSRKLVTSFDLHQTFHEILLRACTITGTLESDCLALSDTSFNQGTSLLQNIDIHRDCKTSHIPEHICPCQ